jgi:hypothetical protein
MMRASRLKLMNMIVRAGPGGYYVRGNAGFGWLRDHGLAEYVNPTMMTHRLTDKGLNELRTRGICDRCGDHGTYCTDNYVTPWAKCDHVSATTTTSGQPLRA